VPASSAQQLPISSHIIQTSTRKETALQFWRLPRLQVAHQEKPAGFSHYGRIQTVLYHSVTNYMKSWLQNMEALKNGDTELFIAVKSICTVF
jgi:hypothetical protein